MKGTALQLEINELAHEVSNRKQYHSAYNLRNMRKRLARLRKQLNRMVNNHKIEILNYGKQLNLI